MLNSQDVHRIAGQVRSVDQESRQHDYIDAGDKKEAADHKIRGMIALLPVLGGTHLLMYYRIIPFIH